MQGQLCQLLRQATRQGGLQGLVPPMGLALQDRRGKPEAEQGHHGAERCFELEQVNQRATHSVAQGHQKILQGAAVGRRQATNRQPGHRRRQPHRQGRRQQQQRQARDPHRDQQAQRAQPQAGGLPATDAAQIGAQTGIEEQQRQAH